MMLILLIDIHGVKRVLKDDVVEGIKGRKVVGDELAPVKPMTRSYYKLTLFVDEVVLATKEVSYENVLARIWSGED